MLFGSFLNSFLNDLLCLLHHFFKYEICFDFAWSLGWMLVSCLMLLDTFSVRARNLLNLKNQFE